MFLLFQSPVSETTLKPVLAVAVSEEEEGRSPSALGRRTPSTAGMCLVDLRPRAQESSKCLLPPQLVPFLFLSLPPSLSSCCTKALLHALMHLLEILN